MNQQASTPLESTPESEGKNNDIPPQSATAEAPTQPPASPTPKVVRRKKSASSGLKIADDLSGFEQIVAEKKAEAPEVIQEEEQVEYHVNPNIQISRASFDKALEVLLASMQQEGKMNLASAIREGKTTINHNQWTLEVANEVLMQIVEREKSILPFMREKLAVNELFMELKVDGSLLENASGEPYTEEQKLKVMTDENPALKQLQKIFKTRIIY